MTREQAGGILAVLVAGFPALPLEVDSVDVFVAALQELDDHELALEVAHRIVRTRPRFPALSELLDEYHARRRRREASLESPSEPSERDSELVAEIRAFADALRVRLAGPAPMLEVATPGACDDGCGHVGERFHSGEYQRCRACTLARIRVAETLEHVDEASPRHEAAA